MGRSPKPLYLVVDDPLFDWGEWREREAQGYTILRLSDPAVDWGKVDVFFSPRAWLMDDAHRKYVKDAIAEARRRRYPKEAREQPE